MESEVFNEQPEGRAARSRTWRVLTFPPVRMVLAFLWLILPMALVQWVVVQLPGRETVLAGLLSAIAIVIVACLAYYAFVRVIEQRPVSELARGGAVAELAKGALLGAALFTLTIGVLWLLGYFSVIGTNDWTAAMPWLAGAIVSGVTEELLFRGILFRIAEEGLGTWLALLISALLFGLLHLGNPNATLPAALAIALEAGVMLAAAFMLTRRLWLPIGIHFAWNFAQGGIFGVAVSGYQSSGLLKSVLQGPALLSGGDFGAEASIIAVIVCGAAGIFLIVRARRKGHLVKPFWRRATWAHPKVQ
jgi:uncharacterized protein